MGEITETIGENREFTVASASDVTVYFNGGADADKTSADDTATEKYTDTKFCVKKYQLRCDQTVQIVSINGVVFTEPITAIIDYGVTEKLDIDLITKMTIRTFTANTNIKLRVR